MRNLLLLLLAKPRNVVLGPEHSLLPNIRKE